MHDEIRVSAVLDRHWSAWFSGLDVSSNDRGQATIAAPVADQAARTARWPWFATQTWSCWRCAAPTTTDADTKGTNMPPSTYGDGVDHWRAPGRLET